MSFPATVYRVLIASPSDVSSERELIAKVIQEWNDSNSNDRQVAILPVRWETHTRPQYGTHPQEAINRQIVDSCDFLIGVFWTRIGTPTETADSGTLDEIERMADQGKEIMLYFSQTPKKPDDIDLDQLNRLREFKASLQNKALIETFADQFELHDKLMRQLDRTIKTLMSSDSLTVPSEHKGAEIEIAFADEQGDKIGDTLKLQSTRINVADLDTVPDYVEERTSLGEGLGSLGSPINSNFYRELVTHIHDKLLFRPLRFWLSNVGSIGARDVFVELTFRGSNFSILPASEAFKRPQRRKYYNAMFSYSWDTETDEAGGTLTQTSDIWTWSFEVKALQPQRKIAPLPRLAIAAHSTETIAVEAKIYADMLPEPSVQELTLEFVVAPKTISAFDILEDELEEAFDKPSKRKSEAVPRKQSSNKSGS